MKPIHALLPVLFALAAPAGQAQAPASEAAPAAPSPAAPAFTPDQILETWGWFIAQQTGIAALEFSPAEMAALARGMEQASAGQPAPHDLQAIGPSVQAFLRERQGKVMAELRARGARQSAEFLAGVKGRPGVVEQPSGLLYEILSTGTGPKPRADQTVVVHYTGTLANGQVFDSSVERGKPEEFVLNQVIPGWTEGLQLLPQGSKARLYIPAHLGYGDEGTPGIPPGSLLVFDVELLEVKDTPAAPAAPASGG